MKKDNKYYSLDRIKKVQAHYKMLLGGRNIGKSYAVKHDTIKTCFDSGKHFIYLRRWDEDIKTKNASVNLRFFMLYILF